MIKDGKKQLCFNEQNAKNLFKNYESLITHDNMCMLRNEFFED